jgi:hypothetical protein
MPVLGLIGRHLATRAVLGIGKKVYQSHKKRKKRKEKFKAEKAESRRQAKEWSKKHMPNRRKLSEAIKTKEGKITKKTNERRYRKKL